jgi:hypothetical protein
VGGLLFSLPLLYTMEAWWAGCDVRPLALLCLVIGTFVLLLGYNLYAGIRYDKTSWEVVIDSVEEIGPDLSVWHVYPVVMRVSAWVVMQSHIIQRVRNPRSSSNVST